MHYNRRARREIGKSLGYLKGQDDVQEGEIGTITKLEKRMERIRRAQEAGKQIHLQFLQTVEESTRKQQEESDAKSLQNKIDWYMNKFTGNKGKGLAEKEATKRATKELQEAKILREEREEIKADEDALRKQLRAEGHTKREIKTIIREVRQEMKADK